MKKEELQKIKKWLPRGYARRIFLETGISFMTIYSTMNGKTNNKTVLDAASVIAQEEKEKLRKSKNKISAL